MKTTSSMAPCGLAAFLLGALLLSVPSVTWAQGAPALDADPLLTWTAQKAAYRAAQTTTRAMRPQTARSTQPGATRAQAVLFDCSVVTTISLSECEALVDLYMDTQGPDWAANNGWLSDPDPCMWDGVDCGSFGTLRLPVAAGATQQASSIVTGLFLGENGLTGALPSSLGDLVFLEDLDLVSNGLTGAIPASLGAISGLRTLILADNSLSGSIPSTLGTLSQLEDLDVFANSLAGSLPSSLENLTDLRLFDVGRNKLSGPVDPWLGSLTNLRILGLFENGFTGVLPGELGALSQLIGLYVQNNSSLTGPIPSSFTGLISLIDFFFVGTDICTPPGDLALESWLLGLSRLSSSGLTCELPNDPPVFTSDPLSEARVGEVYELMVTAVDPDGDSILLTAPVLPDWALFMDNGDGTGLLRGTPLVAGTYTVQLLASDGLESSLLVFTIVVSTGLPPLAADDVAETPVGTPVLINVRANDTDPDGPLLATTVRIARAPLGGQALVQPDGSILYTPAPTTIGEDTFTYTLTDADLNTSNEATVTVTVLDPNQPPLAVDDQVTTPEDTPLLIDVLANDTDPDGMLALESVMVGMAPEQGTAAAQPDGTILYTPSPDFAGLDTFTYTVADDLGAVSAPATVLITVVAINDAPVALNDAATTLEDQPLDIEVLSNDSDLDSEVDPSTVEIGLAPTQGTALPQEDGTIRYTPDLDFGGTDVFTYTVADDLGARSESATVTVTVEPRNDPPRFTSLPVTTGRVGAPYAYEITTQDPDSDQVIMEFSTSANWLTLTDNEDGTGRLSGIPTRAQAYTVILFASDGIGRSEQRFTIEVTENRPPVAQDDAATTPQESAVVIAVLDNDTDDLALDAETVAIDRAPVNGTALPQVDGTIRYTPASAFTGVDTFTYTVADGLGLISDPATVTVTVTDVNVPPAFTSLPVLSVVERTPYQYTVTVEDTDGDVLSLTAPLLPAWLTLSALDGGAASLTGTPDVEGLYAVTLQVSDGTAAVDQSFEIEVTDSGVFSCLEVTEVPLAECEALVALYESTNGPSWTRAQGWLTTNTLCSWQGVGCEGGAVTALRLAEAGLEGPFPAAVLALTQLQELTVGSNALTGPLSPALAQLGALRVVSVRDNALDGILPSAWASLTNVTSFYFDETEVCVPPNDDTLTAWLAGIGDLRSSGEVCVFNAAPVFTSTPLIEAEEGLRYAYAIATEDADGDARTITAPVRPAWLELTDNADGTALLAGTPPLPGDYEVTVRLADSLDTVDQSFTVAVAALPEPSGLVATAGDQQLTASWDGVVFPSLEGYLVRWGRAPDALTNQQTVSALTTTITLQGLENGAPTYLQLEALYTEGRTKGPTPLAVATPVAEQVSIRATVSFGNLAGPEAYRIVSLPGSRALPVDATFTGEPGVDWLAHWDNGAEEGEPFVTFDGSALFTFVPGRAFWVVSTTPWVTEAEADAVPLTAPSSTDDEQPGFYGIELHPGWNLIGHPFDIPVRWADVTAQAGYALQPIFSYDGTFAVSDRLEPYAGYYFFNAPNPDGVTPTLLEIPYLNASRNTTAADLDPPDALTLAVASGTDTVQVSVVRPTEASAAPWADVVAPPGGFGRLDVALERAASAASAAEPPVSEVGPRARAPQRLHRAAMPAGAAGATYRLRITRRAAERQEPVRLRAERLPAGWSAMVVDAAGRTHDLRFDVRLETGSSATESADVTDAWLVVGTEGYLADQQAELAPQSAQLDPLYPNPSGGAVQVSWSSAGAPVRLGVYDLLGRRVRLLEAGTPRAGWHTTTWDGRDDQGRQVASGLYTVVLETGERRITRSLVRVR
ncbi:MAG: Ig-like domain-containing protein [Bacteroidota bacterium]